MWSCLGSSLLPHLPTFFAAGFGGLSGAWIAFLFERKQRKEEGEKANISAAIRAQLILWSYLNTLINVNEQFLNPVRNDSNRDQKLRLVNISPMHLTIDFNSLTFLAEHKKPQVFQDIHLAERSFYSAVDAIVVRNQWFEKHFISNAELPDYNPATGEATMTIDPRAVKILKDHTDNLYKANDHAINKCKKSFDSIISAMKDLFPGKSTLSYSIPTNRQ